MPDQTLPTTCAHCGAPVALRLAGPRSKCTYCGSNSPFSAAVEAQLEVLRDKLRERALRAAVVRAESAATGFGASMSLVAGFGMVILAAAIPTAVAFTGLGRPSRLWSPQVMAQHPVIWWMAALELFTFAALSAYYAQLALAFRRRRGARLAQPPIGPEVPPRCGLCGADLRPSSPDVRVRRCVYCGADNIVSGGRFARIEARYDRLVDQIDDSNVDRLKAEQDRIDAVSFHAGSVAAVVALGTPLLAWLLTALHVQPTVRFLAVPALLCAFMVIALIRRARIILASSSGSKLHVGALIRLEEGKTYRILSSLQTPSGMAFVGPTEKIASGYLFFACAELWLAAEGESEVPTRALVQDSDMLDTLGTIVIYRRITAGAGPGAPALQRDANGAWPTISRKVFGKGILGRSMRDYLWCVGWCGPRTVLVTDPRSLSACDLTVWCERALPGLTDVFCISDPVAVASIDLADAPPPAAPTAHAV